jgi:TPR repeat protein
MRDCARRRAIGCAAIYFGLLIFHYLRRYADPPISADLNSPWMPSLEALLDQLPHADASAWHDEGLSLRMDAHGHPARFTHAHRLLSCSALLGKSAAKYQLGVMNLRGEGRPKDSLRALMWFKLAIARDEPRAAGNLSMVAEALTQAEIKQSYRMAQAFAPAQQAFLRARLQQSDDAVVDIAASLMQGSGVDPDPELAVAWLRRGSVLREPGAQWLVGLAHATGCGARRDVAEGMRLLQQAADHGHAGAQYDLAELMLKQPGASQHARALSYLSDAAERNHLQAMYRLGMLYRAGEAGAASATPVAAASRRAPHLASALSWLERAAELGHAEASYELGQMHAQALGKAQDFEQALHWYLLAADQGHAKAQFNLGFLHSHGQGVEQDYVKAYEWYAISEASGYALARQNLDYIGKKLTPEELELAQWRADSFRHRASAEL